MILLYWCEALTLFPKGFRFGSSSRKAPLSSGADKHYFFPRCYNYELQTISDRRELYTIFERLCKDICVDTSFQSIRTLVKHIYCSFHPIELKKLYDCLEVPLSDFSGTPEQFKYYLDEPEANPLFIKFYNRFYSALLVSKKFMQLCKQSELRFNELLIKIDDFYFQLAQYRLSQQYINQDIYTSVYDDVDIFYNIDVLRDNSLIKLITN